MYTVLLFISGSEIIVILLAAWLLLGSRKLPEAARFLGKGLREIRKATEDLKREISRSEVGTALREVQSVPDELSSAAGHTSRPVAPLRKETPEEIQSRHQNEQASFDKYYAGPDADAPNTQES